MIRVAVFREAKRQNAFTFWNHPMWVAQRPDGISTLTPMHKMLIKEKLLDGIEVVNDNSYSDEALQIALDNNLTIMGTSDVHQLIDWTFGVPRGGHRPHHPRIRQRFFHRRHQRRPDEQEDGSFLQRPPHWQR